MRMEQEAASLRKRCVGESSEHTGSLTPTSAPSAAPATATAHTAATESARPQHAGETGEQSAQHDSIYP